MNNQFENLITSIGATAELLGLFRKQLVANGFDKTESIQLTQTFLKTILLKDSKNSSESDFDTDY